MKKLRGFLMPLLLLAIMLMIQLMLIGGFTKRPPRVEVLSLNYNLESSQALQPSELERMTGYNVTYHVEATGYIMEQPMNIIITNGSYGNFIGDELIQGAFFTERAAELGLNAAVISEDLALQLFNTPQVVKETIQINHQTYSIVGVYKKNPLVTALTSNGRETIYIPNNSDFHRENARNKGIQRVLIDVNGDSRDEFIKEKITRDLQRVSNGVGSYEVRDYTKGRIILRQFPQITGFIAATMLMLCLCRLILKIFRTKGVEIREKLQMLTFKEIIQEDLGGYLILMLYIIISLTGIFLLYRLAAFNLYIPPKYIPSEGLLQFAFYRDIIMERLQSKNLNFGITPSIYGRLYGYHLLLNTIFLLIEIILIIKLYRFIRSKIAAWEGEGEKWQA